MFEKNIIFHSHMQIYNRKCGIYGCILSFSNDVVFVSRLGIDWFIAIQQRLTATCFPLSLHSFIGCWIVPLNWMYPSDIRWNIPYWIFQICKWKMPKINPSISLCCHLNWFHSEIWFSDSETIPNGCEIIFPIFKIFWKRLKFSKCNQKISSEIFQGKTTPKNFVVQLKVGFCLFAVLFSGNSIKSICWNFLFCAEWWINV